MADDRIPHVLVRRADEISLDAGTVVVETSPATFDAALPSGVVGFDTVDGLKLMRPVAHGRCRRVWN